MKKQKISDITLSFLLPILLIVFWYVGSGRNWFNPSIIPTPHKMNVQFEKIISDGSLWQHILTSFGRVLYGYFIGALAGVLLGIAIGLFAGVNKAFLLLIGLLRPIPPIACIPLFILALGIGEPSKIALIVVGAFWPCLLNTISGIQQTSAKLVEVAEIFGKSKWTILKDGNYSGTP